MSDGVIDYCWLLLLNRFDSFRLSVLNVVVSEMLGKNVVCVVLILVLVVIRLCFVVVILGWCNSICDDRFVGRLVSVGFVFGIFVGRILVGRVVLVSRFSVF